MINNNDFHSENEHLIHELDQVKNIAQAKERLCMLHVAEMDELYDVLKKQVKDLQAAHFANQKIFMATIETLALTLEAKDIYTQGHSSRVAEYAVSLANKLGVDKTFTEQARLAASLHDLGKIGITEKVLNKPGTLTDLEFKLIKSHPITAVKILTPLELTYDILPFIKHHHERYDGNGYPDRLKGENIPFGARLIAIADSFDAMTSDRPYRKALTIEIALSEIEKGAGTQFDYELAHKWINLF